MMSFYGPLFVYVLLLRTHQAAAERHTPAGSTSNNGSIIAPEAVSSIIKTWDNTGVNSTSNHSRTRVRSKYRLTGDEHFASADGRDDFVEGRSVSHVRTSPVSRHGASVSLKSIAQDADTETEASNLTVAGSWKKLRSLSNHVGEHNYASSSREDAERAAASHIVAPVRNRAATGDAAASLSQPSFLHTAVDRKRGKKGWSQSTTWNLPYEDTISVSFEPPPVYEEPTPTPPEVSPPEAAPAEPSPKPAAPVVTTPTAATTTAVPPTAVPTTAATTTTVKPAVATPVVATSAVATPAVPTSAGASDQTVTTGTPSSTTVAPGTVATTEEPTATHGMALTATKAPDAVEKAEEDTPNSLLSPAAGEAPGATSDTTPSLEAAASTVASGEGSVPVAGVVTNEMQGPPQPSPEGMPLMTKSGEPSVPAATDNAAVVGVHESSPGQNAPGTVATTEDLTATRDVALTAAVAPVAVGNPEVVTPANAEPNLVLSAAVGETPGATPDTTLPLEAAAPTVASGEGSVSVPGVVIGEMQVPPQPSPEGMPLMPKSGEPSVPAATDNAAAVGVRVSSAGQNASPLAAGLAPVVSATGKTGATEEAATGKLHGDGLTQQQLRDLGAEAHTQHQQQQQQPQLVTRETQQEAHPHGQQQPGKQLRENTAEPTPKGGPGDSGYDRGGRGNEPGIPSKPAPSANPACFDACDCWPVWASSIAVFVIYSAATLAAVLLTASLFSRGLASSHFYKAGGYWLLGAAAAGAATGALIGGLVSRCVGAALGLSAGMMCLSTSLVLVGRRGAWLGALGGVLTGGVIGAMINGGPTPIALGSGIGLLLGVIGGFVPLARQLKMNERYIRRGIAQGSVASTPPPSRMPSKRPTSRTATRQAAKEPYGRSLDAAGSSSEDIRSLAVQRLSSNPIGRARSNMGLTSAPASKDDRHRSSGTNAGPLVVPLPGAACDTETPTTGSAFSSALVERSPSGSQGGHSDGI